LETLERLLAAAGFDLAVQPLAGFRLANGEPGHPIWVPNHLPQSPTERALATAQMPLTVNWAQPDRVFSLADRTDRSRLHEMVLSEGQPEDIRSYIDGTLLRALWPALVLPQTVRCACASMVNEVLDTRHPR
jgi:hypothetical protein